MWRGASGFVLREKVTGRRRWDQVVLRKVPSGGFRGGSQSIRHGRRGAKPAPLRSAQPWRAFALLIPRNRRRQIPAPIERRRRQGEKRGATAPRCPSRARAC